MCDNVRLLSVADVRLDLVNCKGLIICKLGESYWRLEDSSRNQYAKYIEEDTLQTGTLPVYCLCADEAWSEVAPFPTQSPVASVVQSEVMLHWFLGSGYTNGSEMA